MTGIGATGARVQADTVLALAEDGRTKYAIIRVLAVNPRNPIHVSGTEPYVYTNGFNGPEHKRAGMSLRGWYTGTCGWVFRCVTQWMIGVRPDFDGLLIDPVLPGAWKKVTMKRTYRGAHYDITISNPHGIKDGKPCITVDGKPLSGSLIPYATYGGNHVVEAVLE